MGQSKHETLRQSVLTATRNFDHRVKMFYKHIVKGKNNRMCVQFYSYRIEFQDRGAAHVHGVLWLDWKAFCSHNQNVKDFGDKLSYLEMSFKTLRDDSNILSENECKALAIFADIFTTCSLDTDIIKEKLYRLTTTDKDGNEVYDNEKLIESAARKVANTVCDCNRHHHTKSCKKYDTSCRFNVPHFPSKETLVAVPLSKLSQYAQVDEDFAKFKDIDQGYYNTLMNNPPKVETTERYERTYNKFRLWIERNSQGKEPYRVVGGWKGQKVE